MKPQVRAHLDSIATKAVKPHNRTGTKMIQDAHSHTHSGQSLSQYLLSLGRSLTGGLPTEDTTIGGGQAPLLSGDRTWLGSVPRGLTLYGYVPGQLVHPSSKSNWGLAIWKVGILVKKRTRKIVMWCASLFVSEFLPLAWSSHWSGSSRGQHGWNLAGASRNVAEVSLWRNQVLHSENWRTQVYQAW